MPESLEKKRVLVTGADGFIGSHLVERLVRNGASVRAFSHYNSWNNVGWLADADPASYALAGLNDDLTGVVTPGPRVLRRWYPGLNEGECQWFHLDGGVPDRKSVV